jgi:hypothetical protein
VDISPFLTAGPGFASALFAGLALLLGQLHRHKEQNTPSENAETRSALLQLEEYVAEWAWQAKVTNQLAREWAMLPEDRKPPSMQVLTDSTAGQAMWIASIENIMYRKLPALIPPSLEVKDGHLTLERLLRVYSPQLYEGLVVFSRRKEQLETIAANLDRLKSEKSPHALRDYLAELDEAAGALEEGRRRIAEFIAAHFPLGSPQPGALFDED